MELSSKLNQRNGILNGRVLWYDPNPLDNEPINTEDLNISVSLEATSKNKSIIINNNNGISINNSNGNSKSRTIQFIRSYKDNNDETGQKVPTSLSTSYSDIEHIIRSGSDFTENYYESIGIESINIEFNSSYAPMIKIKMVDIRGASLFSTGGKGDYNFFFELPYPLFHLEIKGFYGRPVEYCLHLIRFNASFNSQTGNFEIDCDFIGYTYALLNDMLIMMLRGVQGTTQGDSVFQEIKKEYTPELQPEIIKLDNLISYIDKGKFNLSEKLKKDEKLSNLLKNYNDIYTGLDVMLSNKTNALNSIIEIKKPNDSNVLFSNGNIVVFYDDDNNYITLKKIIDDYQIIIKDNIKQLNKIISDNKISDITLTEEDFTLVNTNIEEPIVTANRLLNSNSITEILSTKKCTIKKVNIDDKNFNSIKETNIYKYIKSNICLNYKDDIEKSNLSEILINNKQKIENDNLNVVLIDFGYINRNLENKIKTILDKINTTEKNITTKLNELIVSKTERPTATIRNLFRVLSVGVDTFLKTLYNVSIEAENSEIRTSEFKKLTNDKDIINYDNNLKVSPWPEYRTNEGDYYSEKYLGSVLDYKKVPELKFTEDLMKTIIDQRIAELENIQKQTQNISLEGQKATWFPISVLDSDISYQGDFNMLNNPYLKYMNEESSTTDNMLTILILRAFLLLGFANKNNINPKLIELHGKLEAWNLKFILDKIKNGSDITLVNELNQINFDTILNKFNDNIYSKNNNLLDYIYIIDITDNRSYLPINGKYSKKYWYKNNTLLSTSEIKTFINDNKIITAGNQNNYSNYIQTTDNLSVAENNTNDIEKDGVIYINLVDKNYIEGSNNFFNPLENDILSQAQKSFDVINYENNNKNKKIKHIDAEDVIFNKTNNSNYVNPYGLYDNTTVKKFINTNIFVDTSGSNLGVNSNDNIGRYSRTFFFADNTNNNYGFEINNLIKYDDEKYQQYHKENTQKKFDGRNYLDIPNIKIQESLLIQFYEPANIDKVYEKSKYIPEYFKLSSIIDNNDSNFKKNYENIIDNPSTINDYVIPRIGFLIYNKNNKKTYSFDLFGSELYYYQNDDYSKAFLFLHTFPFQGLPKGNSDYNYLNYTILDYNKDPQIYETVKIEINDSRYVQPNIFGVKELLRTHNSLIKIPKIWALFIGSILWRMTSNNDPIKFFGYYKINKPRKDEYLYCYKKGKINNFCGMQFINNGFNKNSDDTINNRNTLNNEFNYARVDETLRGLPKQVKDEFIVYFKTWVENEWDEFTEELELKLDGNKIKNSNDFSKLHNKLTQIEESYTILKTPENDNLYYFDRDNLKKILGEKTYNNYYNFNHIKDDDVVVKSNSGIYLTQINMSLQPKTPIMSKLINLLIEPVYMQNANPYVWSPRNLFNSRSEVIEKYHKISISQDDFKTYITSFLKTFKKLTPNYKTSKTKQLNDIKQQLFGINDNNMIKLNIYRTLSSIYQKWISGVNDDKFFAQCSYNIEDEKVAAKERTTTTTPRLIDSFRFVDRAFRDLGDKLYVNPKVFVDLIRNNHNATFFDVTNKVLNDNNFLFIPLPTFINYNQIDALSDVFKPHPNNDYMSVTGPSFVCVYVGQVSNNLDLNYGSNNEPNYPDDGIYVNVSDNNQLIGLPRDFTLQDNNNPYELNVPIFTINYGQQNQNYFKDVRLDQKEFTETAESLEIINDLSNQNDKAKETYIGQNLFNVYQKRSYSCEVEMLGNALIQPMMYFQLNNIPMFKGLYLIINVKHNIKPNSMVTTFKGVRVKKYKTPLLDINSVLYVNETTTTTTVTTTTTNFKSSSFQSCDRNTVINRIKDDLNFLKEIKRISDYLNNTYDCEEKIEPWYILGLMENESACTFDPSIGSKGDNKKNYVGLIQFIYNYKGTIIKYTDENGNNKKDAYALGSLNRVEQCSYVLKFLKTSFSGKIKTKGNDSNKPKLSVGRIYLSVFLPAFVDNLDDVVVSNQSTGEKYGYWNDNPSLQDSSRTDKAITISFMGDLIKTKGNKYKNLNFG